MPGRLFSLAHLTVMDCPPPEMTYLAARAGYDFVSFRPIPMGLPGEPHYEFGTDKELLRRTKAALSETGLALLDIEVARIADGVDPRSYLPAMYAAAELGGRHVLASAWTSNHGFVVDSFAQLCDLAYPLDLTVDLEFVAFANCATLKAANEVVNASGRRNGGILVDTLHFALSGDKPETLSEIAPLYFNFAQICDAHIPADATRDQKQEIAREKRLYLGEGNIDVVGILSQIPRTIPYSIELPNRLQAKNLGNEEHARRCLVSAKEYLDRHMV